MKPELEIASRLYAETGELFEIVDMIKDATTEESKKQLLNHYNLVHQSVETLSWVLDRKIDILEDYLTYAFSQMKKYDKN